MAITEGKQQLLSKGNPMVENSWKIKTQCQINIILDWFRGIP